MKSYQRLEVWIVENISGHITCSTKIQLLEVSPYQQQSLPWRASQHQGPGAPGCFAGAPRSSQAAQEPSPSALPLGH